MALPNIPTKQSPITAEVLQTTVSKIGIKIPEHLVQDYAATLADAQQDMETLMAMDDFVPIPDTSRFPRTRVHYPSKDDNPFGAWAWKATVKNIDDREVKEGLLAGRTVCLKDNVCLAGVPCLFGTNVFSDWVPNTDATIVTRILKAGGVITGKATCNNFCSFGVSNTAAQGPVGNPYDTTRSAGGSSSGTGVLVATGEVDLGIGADQGGSIRVPAAHVGIVGLKPTYGLVPYTGLISGELSVDHVGPMTPHVLSNALLLRVIAGVDGIDDRQSVGTPYPPKVPDYHSLLLAARSPNGGTRKMRIGILLEGGHITGMDQRVFECVQNAARKFKDLDAEVEEISIPEHLDMALRPIDYARFSRANDLQGRAAGRKQLYLTDFAQLVYPWTQEKFDKVCVSSASIMINGLYADERYPMLHGKCHNMLRRLQMKYDTALEKVDILVMPTTPWVAKVMPPVDAPPRIHFQEANGLVRNTQPFNHTGHPALTIPCGMLPPPEGPETLRLPVGMQLVGKHFDELTLYKAALAWSDEFDWKSM
ncbi:amidase signature domain-containing protein [Gautieria morchelliformis]|nr:amidase signature domain-containing protein [Gautieria morchelliformis]